MYTVAIRREYGDSQGEIGEGRENKCLKYASRKTSLWKAPSSVSSVSARAPALWPRFVSVSIMKSPA